jgi:CRP-like cAMP-binding protein
MKKAHPVATRSNAPEPPAIAGISPVHRHIPAGGLLFRCGDRTFGMFFVASGRLRMQRVTSVGGLVTMHTARGGETFAEASLFAERYQCDVVAETDAEVWCYPKGALVDRLREHPESLWEFATQLARDLHGLRQRYELKQIRSAPERVLQLIRLRSDASGIYSEQGTLKDMAAELGLTHEALYRALATLEKRGCIERNGGLRLLPPPTSPRTR